MRFVICLLGQTLQLPSLLLGGERANPSIHDVIEPAAARPAAGNSYFRDRVASRHRSTFPLGNGAGGARRDRTDDLMLAKHALYQLSYGPAVAVVDLSARGVTRKKVWWAQADSNCRPHAYQACALTT